MNRSFSAWAWPIALLFVLVVLPTLAQDAPVDKASKEKTPAAKPAADKDKPAANKDKTPATRSPYRHLVPGVMETVDSMRALDESVSRHDVVELLAFDPSFDWAKDIPFRHDVWVLEFKFKPMRMIWVDVPQTGGRMQRKLVWYMVYSVTNPGKIMHPVEDKSLGYELFDKRLVWEVKPVDRPIRFVPELLLEGHQFMKDGEGFTKVYPDRVIPVADRDIRNREDRNRPFLTSVEIARDIAVGETVWGVATWEDVDPRIVRFSVYVSGLTNSYRWKDGIGEYQKGDSIGKGRKLFRKTLKLNFWRPSDEYFEHEEEIRYGLPGGVDYEWVYR